MNIIMDSETSDKKKKRGDILNKEDQERLTSVESLPSRLQIDVTGRCNMKCPFCYLSTGSKPAEGHLLPRIFNRLQSVFPFIEKMTLYGTGEPLLSPYFTDYFKQISKYDIETYFTTNGTLLKENLSKVLVEHQLDYLSISFSGGDRQSFARIHGDDLFDRIIRNVERLNEIKKERGSRFPILRLSYVASKNALDQFVEVVKLAKTLDCEEGVTASYLVAFDESQLPNIAPKAPQEFSKAYEQATKKGKELGIPVTFKAAQPGISETSRCTRPWDSAFIRYDGHVFMCTESTAHPLGNLSELSFEEIWFGQKASKFQEGYLENSNLCCRYCNQCQNKSTNNYYAHLGGKVWLDHVSNI